MWGRGLPLACIVPEVQLFETFFFIKRNCHIITITLYSLWSATSGLRPPLHLIAVGHAVALAVDAALVASQWQRRA